MTRFSRNVLVSAVGIASLAGSAQAVNYSLNWLDHSPVPFGSPVPNNSIYFLPGVGNVVISYSMPVTYVQARGQNALLQNGNVTFGADNFAWANHETFGATSFAPIPPISTSWNITYTFPGVQPAGSIILGVMGFGQTTSFGGGASSATVLQNGQFLGDWVSGGNYGATQYSGGAGVFSMQNSQNGAGGADPWWNSELGLVRIMDPISSLTVRFQQLSGDGLGLNIASIVPTPGAAALVGLAGLTAMRRRRTR